MTGNREQGTGNREQGTGNREQGTGNREQGKGTVLTIWISSIFQIRQRKMLQRFLLL
ncbi:MAG: hypothetical protein LW708_10825 [Anabaena sp. 49628_E55]|nr:hypothetical protein [Anabaena sp. 49628_E55]